MHPRISPPFLNFVFDRVIYTIAYTKQHNIIHVRLTSGWIRSVLLVRLYCGVVESTEAVYMAHDCYCTAMCIRPVERCERWHNYYSGVYTRN